RPELSAPSSGSTDDTKEFLRVKTRSADKEAVDVRLRPQSRRVLRRHGASIEDGNSCAAGRLHQYTTEKPVRLLGHLRRRGLAGADRLDRLVGDGETAVQGRQSGPELPLQDREGRSSLPLLARLADADERRETMPQRRRRLPRHQLVRLAVIAPPLAVTAERPGAAGVGELGAGDVAGVRSLVLRMEILPADRHRASGELAGHHRQEREGREDRHARLQSGGKVGSEHAAPDGRLGLEEVHLPIRRDHQLAIHDVFSNTTTPGSSLPASSSSDAPPPVETCPMLPVTPAWRAGATRPPPANTRKPGQVGSPRAEARVPASNGGFSNTPSGPF